MKFKNLSALTLLAVAGLAGCGGSKTLSDADVLAKLQGEITLSGVLTTTQALADADTGEATGETEVYVSDLVTYWSTEEVYLNEIDQSDDYVWADYHYWASAEGKVVGYELGIDNTVETINYVDSSNTPAVYADSFPSPFSVVNLEDITRDETDNTKITVTLADESDQSTLVSSLIGYSSPIASLSLTVTSKGVTALSFDSGVFLASDSWGDTYLVQYTFEAVGVEKDSVVPATPTPIETRAEHAALQAAIDSLNEQNYSLSYEETLDGSVVSSFTAIMTSDAFFMTNEYGTSGTIVAPEGGVVGVNVVEEDGNVELQAISSPNTSVSIDDYRPDFTYAAEIFDLVEGSNNSYVLRDDLSDTIADYGYYSPDAIFGGSTSYHDLGSLTVTLNEDGSMEFACTTQTIDWETFEYVTSNISVVISNIGTTVLPYNIEEQYVAFTAPTSWEEYAPELAATFTTLYGSSEAVPFFWPTVGWDYYSADVDYYVMVSATETSLENAQAVVDAYIEVLEAAGFTYAGINDYDEEIYADSEENVVIGLNAYESYFGDGFNVDVYFYDASEIPA